MSSGTRISGIRASQFDVLAWTRHAEQVTVDRGLKPQVKAGSDAHDTPLPILDLRNWRLPAPGDPRAISPREEKAHGS